MKDRSGSNKTSIDKIFLRFSRSSVFCLFLFFISDVFTAASAAGPAMGIDTLMGFQGRAEHSKRITSMVFEDGKTYTWEDFSSWGREIFLDGSVNDPPTGESSSEAVSEFFTCMSCHNYEREDPDLTVQDPDARFEWIEKKGKDIFLLQGTTLWGAVNREAFYQDNYAMYHHLCVPKAKKPPALPCGPFVRICSPTCRRMDPFSLEDAIQVCSAYCSAGRYLEEWELCALLAFFWDQEITLEDINLPAEVEAKIKTVLTSPSPGPLEAKNLRELLAEKYSKKASHTNRGTAEIRIDATQKTTVIKYKDSATFTGDHIRGKRLWRLSCGHCHGTENISQKAQRFTRDLDKFQKMIAEGTKRSNQPYMPGFTLERLSPQQEADILDYLRQALQ
jgi:mono/diheme cytochrome c family protein